MVPRPQPIAYGPAACRNDKGRLPLALGSSTCQCGQMGTDELYWSAIEEARQRIESSNPCDEWKSKPMVQVGPVLAETNPLRLIDVAMWMTHTKGKGKGKVAAPEPVEPTKE